jgi:hypothetical protein
MHKGYDPACFVFNEIENERLFCSQMKLSWQEII